MHSAFPRPEANTNTRIASAFSRTAASYRVDASQHRGGQCLDRGRLFSGGSLRRHLRTVAVCGSEGASGSLTSALLGANRAADGHWTGREVRQNEGAVIRVGERTTGRVSGAAAAELLVRGGGGRTCRRGPIQMRSRPGGRCVLTR